MKNKKISLDENWLTVVTIAYIDIPLILFLFTWLKWYIALIVCAATAYPVCRMIKDYCFGNAYDFEKTHDAGAAARKEAGVKTEKQVDGSAVSEQKMTISPMRLVILTGIVCVFCHYMGYSGRAPQCADWNKHNALMHDLVTRKWPVYYHMRERSMLTYYIAQYLVPAYIGKMRGSFAIAQIAQYIWNTAGVLLVVLHLFRLLRARGIKKQSITLIVFFFFGGMLVLAQSVSGVILRHSVADGYDYFHFLNFNGYLLQYRSNLVSMRWTFQQSIVPWLVTILLYEHRRKIQHYVALIVPVMLYGAFPMLGLSVLALGYAIKELVEQKGAAAVWKRIFSPWNILTAGFLGSVLILYFSGNVFLEKPKEISLAAVTYSGKNIWLYLFFCLFMFGIYAGCIFRANRHDTMYWLSVTTLCVIPFFKMGMWNDLCMGVSVPAQFMLMIFVIRFLLKRAEDAQSAAAKAVLIVCLCIGAIYPVGELYQTAADDKRGMQTADVDISLQPFADRFRDDIAFDLRYNYYTYDLDHSFFVKYIARKSRY